MATSSTVSTALLNQIKALYPARSVGSGSVLSNPWYIVAAVAFSASNKPDAVPRVFEHVLQEMSPVSKIEEQKLLARKLREAVFKSGLISGYPKAINSLRALHEIMPDALHDTEAHRDTNGSLANYEKKGQAFWNSVYGETAGSIQEMLDIVYPDMGWFSKAIGYGLVYGHMEILSPLETSYTLVSALIAGDTPQQIAWHLNGARRCGASSEDVQAVRTIAMEVAKYSGVQWKNEVPEIQPA